MSECTNCGQSAVIQDEDQMVCSACGNLQSENTFYQQDRVSQNFGQDCYSASSYSSTFAQGNYRFRNANPTSSVILQRWCNYVEQVCKKMRVQDAEMLKEAVALFKRAFQIQRFKLLQTKKKLALCGSCVYIICRQRGWPVRINDIVSATDSQAMVINCLYQQLIRELEIEIFSDSVEDYVPTCLSNYGIVDQTLTEKTIEVVSLATDAWLSSGRRCQPVILAACYLAWQSSKRENHDKKLSYFKNTLTSPLPRKTSKRVREIREVVCLLAAKVPWVSQNLVKNSACVFYIDDILKYKQSLLAQLEPPDLDEVEGVEEKASSIIVPPAFRAAKRKPSTREDCDDGQDRKIIKSGHLTRESMDSPELSEKDIPDSEIGLYLKNPEEVEIVHELEAVREI